jgi:hypothetical protein
MLMDFTKHSKFKQKKLEDQVSKIMQNSVFGNFRLPQVTTKPTEDLLNTNLNTNKDILKIPKMKFVNHKGVLLQNEKYNKNYIVNLTSTKEVYYFNETFKKFEQVPLKSNRFVLNESRKHKIETVQNFTPVTEIHKEIKIIELEESKELTKETVFNDKRKSALLSNLFTDINEKIPTLKYNIEFNTHFYTVNKESTTKNRMLEQLNENYEIQSLIDFFKENKINDLNLDYSELEFIYTILNNLSDKTKTEEKIKELIDLVNDKNNN